MNVSQQLPSVRSLIDKLRKKLWQAVVAISIVAGAIGGVVYGISLYKRITERPARSKVLFLGPSSGPEQEVWQRIEEGIVYAIVSKRTSTNLLSGDRLLTPDKIKLNNASYLDDESGTGDPTRVAQNVCSDGDVVLAIGYVVSDAANKALAEYDKSSCRLPIILISPTSTELTKPNEKKWNRNVLRMAPSNIHQASHLLSALRETFDTHRCPSPCKIKILTTVANENNGGYQTDLLDAFRHLVQKESDLAWSFDSEEVNAESDLARILDSDHVDAMVFLGMADKAKNIAHWRSRYLRLHPKMRRNPPILIVSDGSTSKDFIADAGEDSRCVWGIFPYGSPRGPYSDETNRWLSSPSYYAYGHDSVLIADGVLSAVRGEVTRASVAAAMQQLAPNLIVDGMVGQYEFGADGGLRFFLSYDPSHDLIEDQFHMWQVQETGAGLKWRHRLGHKTLESCPG